MSAIPELQHRQIERWCRQHVPSRLRDEVRIECRKRGRSVTVIERRAPWKPEVDPEWTETRVAQLRLDEDGEWSLYWADRSGRWHPLLNGPREHSLAPLLAEIDSNPNGVFWG